MARSRNASSNHPAGTPVTFLLQEVLLELLDYQALPDTNAEMDGKMDELAQLEKQDHILTKSGQPKLRLGT